MSVAASSPLTPDALFVAVREERWMLRRLPLPQRALGFGHVSGPVWLGDSQRDRWETLTTETARRHFSDTRIAVCAAVEAYGGGAGAPWYLDARCSRCGGPHGGLRLESVGAAHGSGGEAPRVSLSSTAGAILVTVDGSSSTEALGVDIEALTLPWVDELASTPPQISERELAPAAAPGSHLGTRAADRSRLAEIAAVSGWAEVLPLHPDADTERRLLQHWTRIEAVLKADGRGLRVDPAAVMFEGTATGRVGLVPDPGGESVAFHVSDLDAGERFVGAVAWR